MARRIDFYDDPGAPAANSLVPSVNGFFSDLEATGRPHAALMSQADLVGGGLILAALLLTLYGLLRSRPTIPS